eukprot:g16049.t1
MGPAVNFDFGALDALAASGRDEDHAKASTSLAPAANPRSSTYQVYYKLDALQPSGSFKLRGVGYTVREAKLRAAAQNKTLLGCVCSSGGNAGLACAYACKAYGLKCIIVLPHTTPQFAVAKLLEMNTDADVRFHGGVWNEANEEALRICAASSSCSTTSACKNQNGTTSEWAYVHPFEGEALYEGHSTIVEEVQEQLEENCSQFVPKVKAFVTVCGGGGLATGILRGLQRQGGQSAVAGTRVLAPTSASSSSSRTRTPSPSSGSAPNVPAAKNSDTTPIYLLVGETVGADKFFQSCTKDRPVTLEKISSVAKSLGSLTCEKMYWKMREAADSVSDHADAGVNVFSFRVPDAVAVQKAAEFSPNSEDSRIPSLLVEPACGAGLAFGTSDAEWVAAKAKTSGTRSGKAADVGGGTEKGARGANPNGMMIKNTDDNLKQKAGTGCNSNMFDEREIIVVEVCGGRMVSAEMMEEWKEKFGIKN